VLVREFSGEMSRPKCDCSTEFASYTAFFCLLVLCCHILKLCILSDPVN